MGVFALSDDFLLPLKILNDWFDIYGYVGGFECKGTRNKCNAVILLR